MDPLDCDLAAYKLRTLSYQTHLVAFINNYQFFWILFFSVSLNSYRLKQFFKKKNGCLLYRLELIINRKSKSTPEAIYINAFI